MQSTITIKSAQQGSETGIAIHFGQGQFFWSCQRGTDLSDFDALLEYYIPGLDFKKITFSTARWWERELYHLLSSHKQERTRIKAFLALCERIRKRYGKTTEANPNDASVKTLINSITRTALNKIYLAGNANIFSGKKSWPFTLPRSLSGLNDRSEKIDNNGILYVQLRRIARPI